MTQGPIHKREITLRLIGLLDQRRLRGGGRERVLLDWIKEGRSGFCWKKLDERNGLEYLRPDRKIVLKRISKLEKDSVT
jgi:hypothetical protein